MNSLLDLVCALVCGWSFIGNVHCCSVIPNEGIAAADSRSKQLALNSALLKLSFPPSAATLIDLTEESSLSALTIHTFPPLTQGEDFELYSFAKDNSIPPDVKGRRRLLGLRLLPGKVWIKSAHAGSLSSKLYIVSLHVCPGSSKPPPADYSRNSTWIEVATVAHKPLRCHNLPALPGASADMMLLLNASLSSCQLPRVIKSKRLDSFRVSSLALLSMQPGVMLINGNDQGIEAASRAVDAFVASHGVLDIVWEPYSDSEPKWWVLVPKPKGMPGHVFAMIDSIQWNHPFVSDAAEYRAQPLCNETIKGCIPGCPKTKIKGISGSGWGADTGHIVEAYQRFFVDMQPMQVGPFRLGYRYTPPLWGGTIGWLYTYGGCESNFLDCYFLEHSPCPRINMDTWNSPGVSNFDKKRFDSSRPENHGWSSNPNWWPKVMGVPSSVLPKHSVEDMHGLPFRHALYTYFFRPNYVLRRAVHERTEALAMREECAAMHVRRGDSIMHTGQARAYLRVDTYVRAARPLMDAMGVKTIFLVTDSQAAIDEALRCAEEHPSVCGGITFRFVEKKRWVGAEGGWENPFPSGVARTELIDIQLEFALAQKCSMAIVGDSNYAWKILEHMCCGFPLNSRGTLPHRCMCPPYVNLQQHGFACKEGNTIMCSNQDKGGDITRPLNDPSNMFAANFSLTKTAFMQSTKVCFKLPTSTSSDCYTPETSAVDVNKKISKFVDAAVSIACGDYDMAPTKPSICSAKA